MAGGINRISTHVLDTALGKPAPRVQVRLDAREGRPLGHLGSFNTDADGRCAQMLAESSPWRKGYTALFLTREPLRPLRMSLACIPSWKLPFKTQGRNPFHIPLVVDPTAYTTIEEATQGRNQ